MNKCYFILVILLTSLSPYRASIALAQSQLSRISGVVTSEVGNPVEGVTVRVKGSDRATSTDADGRYTLELPLAGASMLVFSSTGYSVQEIAIENRSTINITLSTDVHGMDEVVVVGYGSMRKKDMTGAVTQIRPDNIANENPRTVQDILRGTPGVRVGFDPSAKGGGSLQIRGQRSVYDEGGHNSPLLILDGMIYYGELSEINPDDIEQIDILKDASAAAVYGAQAASGVIIITTKKGKPGKPIVNLRTNVGASTLATYRDVFDEAGYLQHREDWFTKNTYGVNPETGAYEAYQTGLLAQQPGFFSRPDRLPAGVSAETWRGYSSNTDGESDQSIWGRRLGFNGNALQNFLDGNYTDWSQKVFRTGLDQDYNASVSGAADRVNYYLSMGYMKNQGVVVSDNYRAVRANMKVDAKVTNWFEMGANVNFQNRSDGNVEIDQSQALRNSPYADYADADGNPVQFPLSAEFSQRGYNYDFVKQFLELEKGFTTLNSILQARVKLPFNINYSFNASPRFQFFHDRYFMSADLPGSDPKSRGVNREQAQRFDWSINNVVSWEKEFNEKHRLNATFVYEAEERQFWMDRINARNILPSDALGFHNTQNGSKEDSSFASDDNRQTADGMLGRLFYSYDDRYQITTSIRRDGYSGFGTSNPHAYFPSVAVAWNFTNEDFFNIKDIVDNGKLRVSYGQNGNRSLADPNLALANLYGGAGRMQGYLNSAGELALYRYLMADRLANPFLQWEKTASWNVGLEFSMFNNRISTTMEYYAMSTHDMIMQQRLPSFTGFERIATNLGQVDNRGFEFTLNTLNIQRENFSWSTNFGMSYNKNRIKHLYYQYEDVIGPDGSVVSRREANDIPSGWFIDQPIDAIWNYRVTGIWQVNEIEEAARHGQLPGDPKVANNYTGDDVIHADGTIKPVYTDDDKEFLGRRVAPFQWSLRSDFTLWKDLSLSFNLYAYTGHKSLEGIYLNNDDNGGNMTYGLANMPRKEYWTPENPTNEYGRIEAAGPVGAGGVNKLYNRSFVRLENITVGYTLPRQWTTNLDVSSIKFFGAIRNVATWSPGWPYADPETGNWAPRLYTFGLNLIF